MRDVTLWQMFAATATRFADRTAVELQRANSLESWTYRELHDAAVAYAEWLASIGIAAGERCAILADNDAAWCAAYLGILRNGAVVVPLDTNYSAEQVAIILADASARVVFVNDRLEATAREALREMPAVVVRALTQKATIPAGSTRILDTKDGRPVGHSGDTAVILYTSGTTADPKGVVLTHGNLIAERDAAFAVVDVSENDSVLGVLPLFHALAQLANLLLPFLVGARVVFLETINSTELVRALSDRRITIFACVPQFFYLIHQRVMAEAARAGFLKRSAFALLLAVNFRLRRGGVNLGPTLFGKVHDLLGRQMRFFVAGGSKFDPAIGRDFYSLGFTILQAYGLTETSGAATITTPDDAHLDTVGRAFPGHEVRIMPTDDPELDGEIAIRGPIVMQGYFNRAEATNAVMRDGWLLTGDLGRLDESGRLTITGRKKEVIVLATGKNIYPEEIEAYYRKSTFIKEICVLGLPREGEPTTERLYAVVVPDMELLRQRRVANAGDLIRFEMEGQSIHLPPHKRVLGYEVWFDSLPRTTTGKVKRHEIERCLRQKQRDAAIAVAQPAGIPAQWAGDGHAIAVVEVLARRAKGATILPPLNLELDLGFDSMERVELLTELEERFGVKVPEEEAHNVQTVAQLIEVVRPGTLAVASAASEATWATVLRDLPPASDPVLASLLEDRPVIGRVLFGLLRLLSLAMPRVHATGIANLPASGPYIITPNHQSYLDPFFVCSVLPYRILKQLFFVGAAEYFESPLTAWFARQCNLVPVDPDAHLVPAMKAGAFGLSHGKILMLFPEGERSIDGTVKKFKKGAPILSRHLAVPIVPVAIHGVFALWPRNRAIDWRLLLPWSGHRVQIAFGAPLTFESSCPDADAAAALRDKVWTLWEALDGRATNEPAARMTF